MIENLRGKTAILTGAAQGLGYAIAKAYAREGMCIALIDVQEDKLKQLAEELKAEGADVLPIAADLADAASTQRAAQQALEHYGEPRVLVHNAALLKERSMIDVTFEQWQKEVNIIMQAAFLLSKAVWQPMIDAGGGSIVFLSSASAIMGFVREVAYTPAKHGQEGLMKVLAMEGTPFNIAVNTVTPGAPMNTPMSASTYSEEMKQRWIDPALLAPAFVRLAKVEAADSTGQRIDAWQLSQSLKPA